MFRIYNKSNRVIGVCGVRLAAGETSEPIMDSFYDIEKSRVDKLIKLGLITKKNILGIDDNEVRRKEQEEFQRKMEEQEAENRRIQEEQEKMLAEMKKAEEKAKKEAEETKKVEVKKTETKKKQESKKEVNEEVKEEAVEVKEDKKEETK